VTDAASVDYAVAAAPHVDALLLDSGNLNLAVKELRRHRPARTTGREPTDPWTPSPSPSFLAGGLTPANVAAAVAAVQPFGIDLCSGVRTNDDLDPAKLKAFFCRHPE